jgi:hypothetical protein
MSPYTAPDLSTDIFVSDPSDVSEEVRLSKFIWYDEASLAAAGSCCQCRGACGWDSAGKRGEHAEEAG